MTSERDTEATGVDGRLEWLRRSVASEPTGAAEAAWAWIDELAKRATTDGDDADVEKNPRLIIRSGRDELVELVRGVYLGKILFNSGDNYTKIGYFALRTPR